MPAKEDKKLEHHAYLLGGAGRLNLEDLKNILAEKFSFDVKNSDLFAKSFETFGIEDSRALKEMQSRKGNFGEQKIFILKINFFTKEAQNALLKVFEEPTPDSHFFISINSTETILPTLKSRLFDLGTISSLQNDDKKLAEDFLSKNAPERLKSLKKITENKDKVAAISLLNALEGVLGGKIKANLPPEEIFVLEEIRKARGYLNDRSPSVKMILEHISLIAPVKNGDL